MQRFALVAGANDGGPDRPALQYAVSDAERSARVLVDLGGVSPANAILLRQPKLRELRAGPRRAALTDRRGAASRGRRADRRARCLRLGGDHRLKGGGCARRS